MTVAETLATTRLKIGKSPGPGGRRPTLAAVCLLLLAVSAIEFQGFLGAGNLAAIAQDSAPILIGGLGGAALLVTGNLDVSVGSMLALTGVSVALVNTATESGPLAWLVGIALGMMLGAVNGTIVELFRIPSLIVTLATLALYRGLAYWISGGKSVTGLSSGLVDFAQSSLLGVPMLAVVGAGVFVVVTLAAVTTVVSMHTFAVGGNRTTARRLGLRPRRLVVVLFALNGALIGIVAVLSTSVLATGSPTAGIGYEIDVLTAVVLGGVVLTGGRGHPVGVLFGVMFIGILNAALIYSGFSESAQQMARGGALLIAVITDQAVQRRRTRRRRAVVSPDSPGSLEIPPMTGVQDWSVEVDRVGVRYPGVQALADVTMEIKSGEVVCVVGDNGAGKSALVGVLAGVVAPETGCVQVAGDRLTADPYRARAAGVATVFQRAALCPNLSSADNLMLGIEPRRFLGAWGIRDDGAAHEAAVELLSPLGISGPALLRPVTELSGGQRQLLSVARVLHTDVKVALMDEPTAGLGVHQGAVVLDMVRRLARSGRAVLYITHDVEEVFEVADRVVVLSRGRVVHDGPLSELTRLELLGLMSGRNRQEAYRTLQAVDEERFRIERDLHDGAQQELLYAALMVGMAAERLDDLVDPAMLDLLRSSKDTIGEALSHLRGLVQGVDPAELVEGGLAASVPALAARSTVPVELDLTVPRLTSETELVAHFSIAEVLTNAQKHAEPSKVAVRATYDESVLHISIADDGRGGVDESKGTGLVGVRARLRAVDGAMCVESSELGTSVRIDIPAARSEPDSSLERRST